MKINQFPWDLEADQSVKNNKRKLFDYRLLQYNEVK